MRGRAAVACLIQKKTTTTKIGTTKTMRTTTTAVRLSSVVDRASVAVGSDCGCSPADGRSRCGSLFNPGEADDDEDEQEEDDDDDDYGGAVVVVVRACVRFGSGVGRLRAGESGAGRGVGRGGERWRGSRIGLGRRSAIRGRHVRGTVECGRVRLRLRLGRSGLGEEAGRRSSTGGP